MLDIKFIRENTDKVRNGVAKKGFDATLVDKVLELDKQERALLQEVETLRAKQNELSKQIPTQLELREEAAENKKELKQKEIDWKQVKDDLLDVLNQVPNIPADDVKEGKGEQDNEEVKKWGEPTKFDFTPKDHLELGTSLGILDFETGAKVAGSQFYYLYGAGAMLELALVQYAFSTLSKEGFIPVITPDLAKQRYYLGTGYAPRGDEAQTYIIEDEDLGLIATAEVTLAGKHADEVLLETQLPIKYIGYSHCFRKEAGAYGKYSKGMYRVHQFTKAEMFIYCKPEDSQMYHEHLLEVEEKIYQDLGLPYRVVKQCTGDLGAMAARKYDIEAWMPGRNAYGEVTSTSNCTDYQSRNLNIKYKRADGKTEYVHMLNGTAIATSRTPIAILENYQQADGSVKIPEALQKFTGFDMIKAPSQL